MTKRITLRITLVALVAALGIALSSSSAMAVRGYLTTFQATYPNSQTATNASCNLCHSSGGGTDLNAYGVAYAQSGSYPAIEALNSDADSTGASNLAEINANAQPGWKPGPTNTLYDMFSYAVVASNQNPPAMAGSYDPAAAPANGPPVLGAIGAKNGFEGQLLAFTVNATDPNGNALTFTAANMPTGATLTDNRNGTASFAWTPGFTQGGNHSVTITVADNGSPVATDFETFTITVGNVNRPPVLGAIANQTVNEGQLLSFTVTATDPDGDPLGFTGANLPTGATLTNNNNGSATFAWTPSYTQGGSYANVTITVTDAGSPAQSASRAFTITVGNVNRAPVLNPVGNRTASVGQLLTFPVTATDPDGDALTFSSSTLPAGATLTDNRNGTASFAWTPASGQAGNYPVTIIVTDAGTPAQTASSQFTITVGAVNRPPVLSPIGARTVNEGQPLQFTINASDPDGNALAFTASGVPTGATVTDNRNGTASFGWTPTYAQAGNYSVTVTVTDNGSPAQSVSETFTISVGNVNRPPVMSTIGNRTVTEGQLLSIAITGTDPDGDAMSFAGTGIPAGATLTDNRNGSAAFAWTPAAGQAGTYTVTVTVTDAGSPAQSASQTFTITVQAPAPVPPPPTTVCTVGVSPLSLAFGSVTVGGSATLSTTISNTGTAACTVSALTVTGPGFALGSGAPSLPATVAPGGKLAVPVTFKPAVAGAASGSLAVASSDPKTPTTSVALSGTGATVSTGRVDLDIDEFKATDEVKLGSSEDGTVRLRLKVKNRGKVNQPRNATVVGVQGGKEVYRQVKPVSAAVGGEATISFPTYRPTAAGYITWTATIADDDPDVDQARKVTKVKRGDSDDDD